MNFSVSPEKWIRNMSDNWKDVFGSDPTDDSDEISQNISSMSDEELNAYLESLGLTNDATVDDVSIEDTDVESSAPVEDLGNTRVSDWLPNKGGINQTGSNNFSDDATSVIPHDVKRISDITRKKRLSGEGYEENEEYGNSPMRRKSNKSGCMSGFMYFIFVLAVSIILASMGWLAACDVLALNKKPITATIEVPENYDMDEVLDDLKENGIIEYKFLFKLFTKIAEKKIDPGTYQLNTEYDYRAIISKMQEGADSMVIVDVTIPEGKSLKQTFELLEAEGVCKAEKLWEAAENYDFEYDFLDPATLGDQNRLEGYLFPDTYKFYKSSSPEYVLDKFLDNFESRITDEMFSQAENMGMTMNQILTIASLIEMEAGSNEERTTISSVIHNRLDDDHLLQIDATIQYILEERKEKLSYDDLAIDNPYNTYMYKGLPPGPIASPGLASIKAAMEPEDTNYFFYALNKSGTHEFFTYSQSAEFEAFTNSEEFGG